MIIGCLGPLPVGAKVTIIRDLQNKPCEQPGVVVRVATREEYLADAVDSQNLALRMTAPVNAYYYEVVTD